MEYFIHGTASLNSATNHAISFFYNDATGKLYAKIGNLNYCIETCGNGASPVTTTTTPSPGGGGGGGGVTTTTTTTTTPAAYRLCNPGDLGLHGCNNPAECRQGASGGTCDPNAATTTTTTAAATTTTTTTTVAATTTTVAATTTTTTTTAPAYNGRTCTPGVLGLHGCNAPGDCVSPFNGLAANCTI